ncbi:chemotaxis protein MotD [Ensifer adhaerens]|nr:chemotaxis protein MotD [Ensifer adhaerens]
MNAIDQYVAPAPPRPNPPPAQAPRSGSDSSGSPTFGDVYNQAASGNQSDDQQADDAHDAANGPQKGKVGANSSEAANNATGRADAKAPIGAATGSAIFTLAAEANAKKAAKSDKAQADAQLTEEAAPENGAVTQKQNAAGKAAADAAALAEKLLAKQTAEAQAQQVPETDAAAVALKLLGADIAAKGDGKKLPVETADKKDEPTKDASTETKAAPHAKTEDAGNTLLAASLVVQPSGEQAKDQQEQGKPKSDDLLSRAISTQSKGPALPDEPGKTNSVGEAVKPETITVLDARRFVGSGEVMSANTHAVMSGVTGDGDWAAAMKAASAAATATPEPRTATPVNTLKIQMTPESLGNVTATLRLHGDQLTVHLSVESGEAFKQLSHDKDGLIQSLKSQGFSVDQVSVQMAPTPSSDRTVTQASSGQQTGGQMQDGSSAGQFAQQGREQDNGRRQQNNGFNANWQGDDKSVAVDPVPAASDTVRTGQVYL